MTTFAERDQLLRMARYVDRAAARVDHDQAIARQFYEVGFAIGYEAGYSTGARQTQRELDEAWNEAATPLAHSGPSYAELERRRREPAELAEDFRRRHGGEYQGGPVEWETGRPAQREVPRGE